MNVNNKNGTFKDYITYSWRLLLIVLIFSYAFWYYVVSWRTEYKKEETFSIFITSYDWNNQLEDELYNEFKDDGILDFNVYNFSIDDKDLSSYYTNFGVKSDILILYEFDLNDMDEYIDDYYMVIPSKYSNQFDCFKYNEAPYGIKLYDNENNEYNNSLINKYNVFSGEKNQDVYILINKKSVHFDNEQDIGYSVLDYILAGDINGI